MSSFLKAVWCACCTTVLAVTLWSYTPNSHSDIGIFLVATMLVLSFPAGLLVAGAIALLAVVQEKLSLPILDLVESNGVGFSILWALFFGAGYWQWFWLVPRLLQRTRAWMNKRRHPVATTQ